MVTSNTLSPGPDAATFSTNREKGAALPKEKVKVLHTIRQGTFGGGETYVYNLVSRLDPARFESVVLSFSDGNLVKKLRERGIKTYVIASEKPFDVGKYGQVGKIIAEEKINLLHIHGTRAGSNTLFPALWRKIPSMYSVHGWSFHPGKSGFANKFRIYSERLLTSLAHTTVCVSHANLQEGKAVVKKGNYQLIQNGIITELFNPATLPTLDRTALGLQESDFVIAFLARMTLQKDPGTLIKAMPLVLKRVPQAKLLLVGGGELRPECEQLVQTLGLSQQVLFQEFTSQVADFHKLSDAFVLPSLWEGLSLALLEAMALGKASIASDIQPNREVITDGVDGLLFQTGNEVHLAEKIIYLHENPTQRASIEKKARATVLEKFEFGRVVQKTEETYTQILSEYRAAK